MKIVILGGRGFIGNRLFQHLNAKPYLDVWRTSRTAASPADKQLKTETLDLHSLQQALSGMDCVVNCVAGNAVAISKGAHLLVQAAQNTGVGRIIHLSSMAVYGDTIGRVSEDSLLPPPHGWYGKAKCEAEGFISSFVQQGGAAVVLRPGCVGGNGSDVWVGRIGRWLRSGRLGEIGKAGDGWSNLVHVLDVCLAIEAAMTMPVENNNMPIFNLSAPDSPRWNEYFVDLALAIGATPVKSISERRLKLDSMLLGPPLKILERLGLKGGLLPDALPPSLVRLWSQPILLDSAKIGRRGLPWTSYDRLVEDSASWFLAKGR